MRCGRPDYHAVTFASVEAMLIILLSSNRLHCLQALQREHEFQPEASVLSTKVCKRTLRQNVPCAKVSWVRTSGHQKHFLFRSEYTTTSWFCQRHTQTSHVQKSNKHGRNMGRWQSGHNRIRPDYVNMCTKPTYKMHAQTCPLHKVLADHYTVHELVTTQRLEIGLRVSVVWHVP